MSMYVDMWVSCVQGPSTLMHEDERSPAVNISKEMQGMHVMEGRDGDEWILIIQLSLRGTDV